MELNFLGTGGGRFTTASQGRKTAGIIIETEGLNLHLDPGPGALVEVAEKEYDLDGVILTHSHLDHCNDAEALIERITELKNKRCFLLASESALNGFKRVEKSVSEYHKNLCSEIYNMNQNKNIEFEGLKIQSQEMKHSDQKCVGLKISNDGEVFGFWSDSRYSQDLTEFYGDCSTLIVNCVFPRNVNSNKIA